MPVPGPLVVLEGPDGGGKSTLAAEFVKLGYEYVHLGAPERPAYEHWISAVRNVRRPTVFDRLHVGSYAYGHEFRGMDDLTTFERWLLDGALLAAGAALVYVRPPDETLDWALRDARPPTEAEAQHYEQLDKQVGVRRRYDRFFDEGLTDLPVFRYDWTTDSAAWTAWQVTEFVRTRSFRPLVHQQVPALGNLSTPDLVFVGDEPVGLTRARARARRRGLDEGRFVRTWARVLGTEPTVFNSPSGEYLHRALRTAGLRLRDYCVVNATQPDGRPLREVLRGGRQLDRAEFVALGVNADRELTRAGISHRTAPHPQYVKRFHHRRGLIEYPEVLLGNRGWS